ncbi:MAG: addiction module toxin, HicA family [Candidatus Aminicenantes bacterium]|nr:addiction module toxin, HicA family [Candidatus Aminicenantes bacterium]
MKREAFLRERDKSGCVLKRSGRRHDLYLNPRTGKVTPVPRHQEIKNTLCFLIKKQLGLTEK